jgi:uncharacterized protein (DUF983 family)
VSDSLEHLVGDRDRQFTDPQTLNRNKRERVARRVCAACWRVTLPKRFLPALTRCAHCGGELHEVLL